ncbi:MAG: hypothetical protein JSS78_06815 [Bacteroidetes bacterium]|nr:hypothetical protein [Bacteroidota bacterium]
MVEKAKMYYMQIMASAYLGYNSDGTTSRIGFSTWWVQDASQNWMHQSWFKPGNQNYYLDYSKMYQGTSLSKT